MSENEHPIGEFYEKQDYFKIFERIQVLNCKQYKQMRFMG